MKNTIGMVMKADDLVPVKSIESYRRYVELVRQRKWREARLNIIIAIMDLFTAAIWLASYLFKGNAASLLVAVVWLVAAIFQIMTVANKVRYGNADVNAEIKTVRHDAVIDVKGAVGTLVELSKEFDNPGFDQHDLAAIEDARDLLNDLSKQLGIEPAQTQGNEVSASDRVTSKQIVSSAPVSTPHSKGVSLRKPSDSSGGGVHYARGEDGEIYPTRDK